MVKHSNNLSAICRGIAWVCLTILWNWRLKSYQIFYYHETKKLHSKLRCEVIRAWCRLKWANKKQTPVCAFQKKNCWQANFSLLLLLTEIFIELSHSHETTGKWNRVYKNRASRICGIKPLKNLRWHIEKTWEEHITSNFLKAVFHKF